MKLLRRTYLRQWPMRELKLFAAQVRKEDELAVESTGNTRLFHDAVVEHLARVAVVNPSQFKVISQSVKKTDKKDAELLALYLAKGLLPEVRMKECKQRVIQQIVQGVQYRFAICIPDSFKPQNALIMGQIE